jgi:hypothetical protein
VRPYILQVLEQQLLKTLQQVPHTCSQIAGALSSVELDLNNWEDLADPTGSVSTVVDIRACVCSENPSSTYQKDPEDFQEVVDAALKEHNQTLTRYFLESAQSGNFRPFQSIGSFGAHNLSTFQEFCALCNGDCALQGRGILYWKTTITTTR